MRQAETRVESLIEDSTAILSNMIKAVVFDWGDVIAPAPHGGWINYLAGMLDLTVAETVPHWRAAGYQDFSAGLISESRFWLQFEKSLGRPLPDSMGRLWTESSARQPWPEILALIDSLRKNDIVTAILSNTVKPLSAMLRQDGQYDGFDSVILSDEVGLSKPDPEIYQLLLNKLGLEPEECIFVDDKPRNLIPASSLGMITILAPDNQEEIVASIESALQT